MKSRVVRDAKPDELVISIETKFWDYKAVTVDDLVTRVKLKTEGTKHEYIFRACKLYFDLDFKSDDTNNFDIDIFTDLFQTAVIETFQNVYPEIKTAKPVWLRRRQFTNKISFHVIYPTVWFESRQDIIPYATKLQSSFPAIDMAVYRNGNFRVAFSPKYGYDLETMFVPLDNSDFNEDILKLTLVSFGTPSSFVPKAISASTGKLKMKKAVNPLFEHHFELQKLIDWLCDVWILNIVPGPIQRLDVQAPTYVFLNQGHIFCPYAQRHHKSNKVSLKFTILPTVPWVNLIFFCVDENCRKPWQFLDTNLTSVLFSENTI